MKIKVLMADDHALFRDGMRYVLQQLADEVEILDSGNFQDALQLVHDNPDADLALLDLNMPGSEGVPSIQFFHLRHPEIPLVVVSGSDHRDDIESVMESGAMGFISKMSSSKIMLSALRMVLEGGVYLPPQLLQQAVNNVDQGETLGNKRSQRAAKFGLTSRQLEVLTYLASGLANKEISKEDESGRGYGEDPYCSGLSGFACQLASGSGQRGTTPGILAARAQRFRGKLMALLPSPRPPLPERLLGLLRESRWLLLVAVALYLILILFGFNRADPSWSHSASAAVTHNPGGVLGAWLADVLLYLFGFSAWWWVTLMLQRVWAGYRRIRADSLFDQRALWVSLPGFLVLLFASSALEALRLYTWKVSLPLAPGGMLGAVLGRCVGTYAGLYRCDAVPAGVDGGELQSCTADCPGCVLSTGWVVGWKMRSLWARNTWQTRQDKRIGAQAMHERSMPSWKKKRSAWKSISPSTSRCRIAKCRVRRECKRRSRFRCSPICRIHRLPPLHLLDQATQQVEVVSAETLEFTSRLIERKLKDFGVEVKVVGAYPGPVITRYEIDPAVGVKGSQITNLVQAIWHARLSVVSIRVVETIPGKSLHGAGVAQSETADGASVRNPRFASVCRNGFTADAWRWARIFPASRWWLISARCRTCWWQVPPVPANRWRSTP